MLRENPHAGGVQPTISSMSPQTARDILRKELRRNDKFYDVMDSLDEAEKLYHRPILTLMTVIGLIAVAYILILIIPWLRNNL